MSDLRAAAAAQLKAALADSGRQQNEVAWVAGISPKHLSQMLSGKAGTCAAYDKVATALGVTLVVTAWPVAQ